MTIGKLIEILTRLRDEYGDVDVYSHNDMIADAPEPIYVTGGPYMSEGVYLN